MNPDTQVMNFCDKFFDEAEGIKPTNSVLGQCANVHLRDAQRSRAAVIIHESSHTNFAMGGEDGSATRDYAYGFTACSKLALGTFDRSCVSYANPKKLLCESRDNPGQEGLCAPDRSTKNADTYSFVATGVWFTERCNREIPFPPPAETITDAQCTLDKDYIVIDGEDEDELSVKKYVHFGDSYASGMGTGKTSGDSCRVGSNNCECPPYMPLHALRHHANIIPLQMANSCTNGSRRTRLSTGACTPAQEIPPSASMARLTSGTTTAT